MTDENGEIYRNAAIRIDAPDYGFSYSNAAGVARTDTGEAMTVDHQFTIASVGKTMTAVVILQLWEEGALGEKGLDSTLADLQAFPPQVLDALLSVNGVSYGRDITVRQLLNQTTGLKDVLMDDENGLGEDYPKEYRGYAPASLNGLVVFDPARGFDPLLRCLRENDPPGCNPNDYYLYHTWRPWDYDAWAADPSNKMAGLLNFYLGGMNKSGLWKPGTAFHYADTNYIILGLLIEKITGNSLHHELRSRIFDPLGMDTTYLAYSTNPPTQQWEKRHSDHWGNDTPLVSSGMNLSMDWGAGGEVSTLEDLSVFTRALAAGKLFKHETTLKEMALLPDGFEQPFYAAGIIAWPTGEGLILHHNGAPGSWIEYHTAYHLSMVGTVNDLDRVDRFTTLRGDVYAALAEAGIGSWNLKTGANSMQLLTVLNGDLPLGIFLPCAGCLLVFLSALVVWPVSSLRRNKEGQKDKRMALAARWVAAGTIFVDLLFVVFFILTVMQNPVQLMFGYNPSMRLLFLLPVISGLLLVPTAVFTIFAWKKGWWGRAGRIHYTLVALAAVSFLWVLSELRLLIV